MSCEGCPNRDSCGKAGNCNGDCEGCPSNAKPERANESCPGPQGEGAGTASACEGCPNAKLCASGAMRIDPDIAVIASRLSNIKHIILVVSGKGGVGKSSVSVQLSQYLANVENKKVGILDIDICGPSVPTLTGTVNEPVNSSAATGWEPVAAGENLSVMSIGFLLPDTDSAVVWRGPRKNGLIKNFLKDVHWGPLDYLVIDTPPGTSDEHLSIIQFLKDVGVDGAVVVTTPQEVALADVRKEINFCRLVKIPVLGVVENMSGMVCPCCNHDITIFQPTSGGPRAMCEKMGVPYAGRIPLDPTLAKACDTGVAWTELAANAEEPSLGLTMFRSVVQHITDQCAIAKANQDSE